MQVLYYIGFALIGFGAGVLLCTSFVHAFNMTEDLLKEERLVQTCIAFHIEASECEAVYGGTPGDGIITEDDSRGLELK